MLLNNVGSTKYTNLYDRYGCVVVFESVDDVSTTVRDIIRAEPLAVMIRLENRAVYTTKHRGTVFLHKGFTD